jgi:4-amino-4-deoxy-L-arabinose transferase-like glycosyltransferase
MGWGCSARRPWPQESSRFEECCIFMSQDHDVSASRSSESRRLGRWRVDWALVAILLLAGVLRLHNLAATAIWVDEANSILTAKQPASVVLDLLSRDSSPPLYYFLLKSWMAAVGDSPAAVRLLSTISSLMLVAGVFAIGRREIGRRAGLWAALLLAIAPTQVFYSQQARMYTLLPLLALTAWWFLVQYLRGGRTRDFWVSMFATAAALYTHNFAVYVPLVHVVLVIASGQLLRRFGMWVVAVAFLALALAPWLPTLLTQIANGDHYAWYVERWEREGYLGAAVDSLRSWSPAGSMVMYARAKPIEWYGVPAAVATGFAIFGGVLLVRSRAREVAPGSWWLIAACSVPVLASLGMSAIVTPHYVPGRVDQMMLPCFVLLVGAGLAAVKPLLMQRVLMLGCLVVALIGRGSFYSDFRRGGVAGAGADLARAVIAELHAGDVVLCTSLTRAPLEYYLQRSGADVPVLSYPRATARHLGSQNHQKLLADDPGLLKEARIVIDRARSLAESGGRLILLRTDIPVNRYFERGSLEQRFGVEEESRIGLFKLDGTKEYVWLTLNRLTASAADVAPQRAGEGS